MESISHHITPLVIDSLGGGHTHANTHTDDPHMFNFKKPGARRPARTPGLKMKQDALSKLIQP